GWQGSDRYHGHSFYTQNLGGNKYYTDNIAWGSCDLGMQVYGSDAASLNNFHIVGNTLFNSGFDTGAENLVVGGGQVANDPVITDNYVYNRRSYNVDLGYSSGCSNAVIQNNVFTAQGYADTPWVDVMVIKCAAGSSITGNTFYGMVLDETAHYFNPPLH